MKIPLNKWMTVTGMFAYVKARNPYFQDLIKKDGYFSALHQFIQITNEKIHLESRLS